MMFKSATYSTLKAINAINNNRLRLAIDAFRSSPILNIYNIAEEHLPEIKRTDLALKYMVRTVRANFNSLIEDNTKIHQELKVNGINVA
jgi:hypothetical protein